MFWSGVQRLGFGVLGFRVYCLGSFFNLEFFEKREKQRAKERKNRSHFGSSLLQHLTPSGGSGWAPARLPPGLSAWGGAGGEASQRGGLESHTATF